MSTNNLKLGLKVKKALKLKNITVSVFIISPYENGLTFINEKDVNIAVCFCRRTGDIKVFKRCTYFNCFILEPPLESDLFKTFEYNEIEKCIYLIRSQLKC